MERTLLIDSQKIRRWYKDVLSGFSDIIEADFHQNDIEFIDTQTGEIRNVIVPICSPKNMGSDMCIDETMIGEEFFTILSSRITGNIAFMANTTRSLELKQASLPLEKQLENVKVINRDLANSYRKFCDITMPTANQVGDKFHVVKLLLDAQQAVRIKQKRKIDTEKREAHNIFKKEEKTRKEACLSAGKKYKKQRFTYHEKKLSNSETPSQILRRSRYLLYKFESQWTEKQTVRARVLFNEFPEIETAYKLSCNFRDWYSKKNIGKEKIFLEQELFQWYENVEISGITELMNFSSTVEINQEYILNYFYNNGASNAMAENRNGKIKKFINANQGTRDKEFFFFRLKKYFT